MDVVSGRGSDPTYLIHDICVLGVVCNRGSIEFARQHSRSLLWMMGRWIDGSDGSSDSMDQPSLP